jgi:predicted esterase
MKTRQDRPPRPDDGNSAGGSEAAELPACLPNVAFAVEAEMRSYKHRIHSVLLHRMAHADIFEVGAAAPTFLFILFGGSGVDEEEYERRSHTVIPVFVPVLERLSHGAVNAVMAYVSAPYDVPFSRFASDLSAADTWNAHVLAELLKPWSKLPYFVSGFSGGAALALNGLHKDPRCFGGAALGADAIPPNFVCPDHWAEKLRLYAAPHDRVCNHPANRRLTEALESRGQAEEFELRSGEHRLADYSTLDCLGELIRFAGSIVPKV